MIDRFGSAALVACAIALSCAAVHAQSTTVTFDSGGCNGATSGPAGTFRMESVQGGGSCAYQEQGFSFAALVLTAPYPGPPAPGDTNRTPGTGTTISAVDSSTFSLSGFAASDQHVDSTRQIFPPTAPGTVVYQNDYWSQTLHVTGFRADGTSVVQEFSFDGSISGFETFALNASFTDLARVEIYATAGVHTITEDIFRGDPRVHEHRVVDIGTVASLALIDNVQVTPVPEPGTLTLVGLPLLAGLAVRRRRAGRG